LAHLVDELKWFFEKRGAALPGKIRVCGSFADLIWDAQGFQHALSSDSDPAFTVVGYTRWLAFVRIGAEIRYFAGPLPRDRLCDWYREDPDEARFEAVGLEAHVQERGRLNSVDAAGALAESYLAGTSLKDIPVERSP
jgi:hypothetical protein